MAETLPLASVKSKFSEMVDRVEHTHDRIIYEIDDTDRLVIIHRIDHCATAYRPR